jgi:hypothetical protein
MYDIQEHIATNSNKFKKNFAKLRRDEILTSQQYHTSLSQLTFVSNNKELNYYHLFPFLKDMDLGNIIRDVSMQIMENFFPLKGVCKAKNPFNVPNDVFLAIASFIPLQSIKSHEKNIEIERRLKEESYMKVCVDVIASTSLACTSGMLVASALGVQGLPVIIFSSMVVNALREIPYIHKKAESFVERITQSMTGTQNAVAA